MAQKVILVIDDDEDIRDTLVTALEIEGYTVYSAKHGLEGLEKLKVIPRPNLIFVDLMMPVMDGWRFLEELSKNEVGVKIPVVVLSAYCDRFPDREFRPYAMLKKPTDIDQVFKMADSIS